MLKDCPMPGRIVAFEAIGSSYFRFQDLTIKTDNAPAATATYPKGVSTYALFLSSCSNYDIVRCQLLPGNASAGLNGTNGIVGTNGTTGGSGGSGGNGCSDGTQGDGGTEGRGAGSSHTSAYWDYHCGSHNSTTITGESANGGCQKWWRRRKRRHWWI